MHEHVVNSILDGVLVMNNLIFIEGVSGVGKTTIAASLHNKLRDMGNTFVCYLEGDCKNPLDPFNGTYPTEMPLSLFVETYTNCWRLFMKNQFQQEPKIIFDGTLLHHQINDLIRNYNAPDDVIVIYLTNLLQIVEPMKPIVFYLSSGDVGQRLLHARESRGQSILTKEQITFWENRKRIDLFVLERLSAKSRVLNVDYGWDLALEMMIKCVTGQAKFTL